MTTDVKKKIRPGVIRLADGEKAIIVEYDQEEFPINADGSLGPSLGKQAGSKKIKVKSINASTNLELLAQELVEKCKLIQPSKLPQVQDLLQQLLIRESCLETESVSTSDLPVHTQEVNTSVAPAESGEAGKDGRSERRRSKAADGEKTKKKERRDKVGGVLQSESNTSIHDIVWWT